MLQVIGNKEQKSHVQLETKIIIGVQNQTYHLKVFIILRSVHKVISSEATILIIFNLPTPDGK